MIPAAPMTTQDFYETRDLALPFWSTLGESAIGGLKSSFLLGTTIQQVQTPELALTGFGPFAKSMTAEEVAANGDHLYANEDEYKASPYYRPNIPWAEGMTASRAKAIADWNDTEAIREYWTSKRPYTAFFGHLIGSLPDPINYIPIFGEFGAAASIGGRVGGAILKGAAEGAANTAIFGALTAPERAQFGQDVSWETMAQQMAYGALAGAIAGGVHSAVFGGATTATPEVRSNPLDVLPPTGLNRMLATRVMNDAIDGTLVEGRPNLDVNSQAIVNDAWTVWHGSAANFNAFDLAKVDTGEGAQAHGHGIYVAEEQAVGAEYRKTVAAQKAAQYGPQMEAITPEGTLYKVAVNAPKEQFIDGDKPLSQQSPYVKDALKTLAKTLPKATLFSPGIEKFQNKSIRKIMSGQLMDPSGQQLYTMIADALGGRRDLVTPAGKYQVPFAAEDKASALLSQHGIAGIRYLDLLSRTQTVDQLKIEHPPGGGVYASVRINDSAAAKPVSYRRAGPFSSEEAARAWAAGKEKTGTRNAVIFDPKNLKILEKNGRSVDAPSPSFAAPKPVVDTAPIEAAEKRVDTSIKSDPQDTQVKGMKELGVDPETGTTPFDEHIAQLREAGQIEPGGEDDKALVAEDENIKSMKVYTELMQVASRCPDG